MHRPRIFLVLVGLAVSLVIAAGALAATLVFESDDSTDETTSAGLAASTPPALFPTAVATTEPPDGIPDELWLKIEALPDKLRSDLVDRFDTGAMAIPEIETVIEQYENRDQGVRVGTVIDSTDSMLRLEVYTTGERAEVALNNETVLRRGHDDIKGTDLAPDELVLVISRDGGETAFSVDAFGVGAP